MSILDECLETIKLSDSIAIFTHKDPDTDAVASAVALKKLIKTNFDCANKVIDIFYDGDNLSEPNKAIIGNHECNTPSCSRYNLGICVDCASKERLGKFVPLFNECENSINIDHHLTNTMFAKHNMVLKASSTCESIYLLSRIKYLRITDDICNLIYAGIITDTNNLQQNVTKNTYKIITEFMDRKINIDKVNDLFFKNNTKSKAFLLKKALDTLRFFSGDRIAYMKISKSNLEECGAGIDDTLGIVDHGIDIKGVDIAILAIKKSDDEFHVSLRSKGGINVANIAKRLGGGGHEQVAAFQYKGTFSTAFEKLINLCNEQLKLHPSESFAEELFIGEDEKSATVNKG